MGVNCNSGSTKLIFCIASAALLHDSAAMFRAEGPIMRGKTVIITGANAGIGFETASELAKYGARVIMACRNVQKAEEARKVILERLSAQSDQAEIEKRVVVKRLDLSSLKSVRAFADDISKSESRLDVLINNAGIGASPQREMTEDGLELAMETNHFGHFLLTNLLLPLLKRSAPARIIVLSSGIHTRESSFDLENLNGEKKYASLQVYTITKIANIYFTRHLAKLLEGSNVIVNAVHPGLVDTDIFKNLTGCLQCFMKMLICCQGKTPLQGAQTSVYLAASSDAAALVNGRYFADLKEEKVSKLAQNDEIAARLWEISEKKTGLKP